METRTAKLAATALIFNEDKSKLLGVSRKDDTTKFGLPGGKVDVGETLYEALVRELKEETGLDVNSAKPIFFREDGDFVAVVYLVTDWSGEVSTTEKGIVKWITFDDLKHGAFSEYNTMLEEHLKFIKLL
jgi:8-oxo-dGTP diphosphatase